jgi:hypothetical protein
MDASGYAPFDAQFDPLYQGSKFVDGNDQRAI